MVADCDAAKLLVRGLGDSVSEPAEGDGLDDAEKTCWEGDWVTVGDIVRLAVNDKDGTEVNDIEQLDDGDVSVSDAEWEAPSLP